MRLQLIAILITSCQFCFSQGTKIGILNYELLDNKTAVVVSDSTEKIEGDVVIPEKVKFNNEWYKVEIIGYSAFSTCKELKSLQLPNSIKLIRSRAFEGCSELSKINLPESLKKLESAVFYRCVSLKEITIPAKLTSIGEYAFSFCNSLNQISVNEDNPTYASNYGVLYNKNVTSLIKCPEPRMHYEFPSTVTSFQVGAFENCTSLAVIDLPERITTIPSHAFWGCSSLVDFYFHSKIDNVGPFVFMKCEALENFIVDKKNIHFTTYNGALYNNDTTVLILCPQAKNQIDIYKATVSIGANAFLYCSKLVEIDIPESVTQIGNNAFDKMPTLERIKFNSKEPPSGQYELPLKVAIHVPLSGYENFRSKHNKEANWQDVWYVAY